MSQCKHIIPLLSEYHEGELSAKTHQEVAEHLAGCSECALADRDLRRSVTLLRHLPMPEPRLDLWSEFAPKLAQVEAERKLGIAGRLGAFWNHAMSSIAEGTVLYTQAVANRTLVSMERYLIHDPFRTTD
jgi:anti-sigma factor RsiW